MNVDSDGNNIVGDAANEPSIAIDPTDPSKIVIGWRQFNAIRSDFRQAGYGYSHDAGESWTFPGVLVKGVFGSDPVLGADSLGNFYYYSLRTLIAGDLFVSEDSGVTWLGPFPADGGDKPWMTIDRTGGVGDGNIYVMWRGARTCCDWFSSRSLDAGRTFEGIHFHPASTNLGTLDVGPDGEVYAIGDGSRGAIVSRSDNAKFPDQVPTFDFTSTVLPHSEPQIGQGPNPHGLLGQLWIATDHSEGSTRGNVYVLGSVHSPTDVVFSRSTDRGETWSEPIRVDDDRPGSEAWHWFGTMSVAPGGRIDVIWNDTRNDPNGEFSEVRYAYSVDTGQNWSASLAVTPPFNHFLGYTRNQGKLGDYYHMISDEIGAGLAYAATFNGEQDVYFLRVGDCNANGLHDSTDISAQPSDDRNQNGILDKCEPDCNGNDEADSCDIEDGISADCNSNGVPDECEPQDDCDSSGTLDFCDIFDGTSQDCDGNGVPDQCDPNEDCNGNTVQDVCDVATGTSKDCNGNSVPDECEPDCNANGIQDSCDPMADCNENTVQDVCDIGVGDSLDCNANWIPDECEADEDCNGNQIQDICDVAAGTSPDCNRNEIPDECESDCNANGVPDDCDLAPVLYAVEPWPPTLYTIDPHSGLATVVAPMTGFAGDIIEEIVWSPDGRDLYASSRSLSVDARALHTVDPRTGEILSTAANGPGRLPALEFDAAGELLGLLVFFEGIPPSGVGPTELVRFNDETGAFEFVAPVGLRDYGGLAFDERFEVLLTIDALRSVLYSIDPESGTTRVVDQTFLSGDAYSLTLAPDGGLLTVSRGNLLQIDPTTAAPTEIGPLVNVFEITGLSFGPGAAVDHNLNGLPDACDCAGDVNGDGSVDAMDVGRIQARFGCATRAGHPSCLAADANGDRAVDAADVGFVQARFGSCSKVQRETVDDKTSGQSRSAAPRR